jgi:transcriptional regulator with XRE-family HTH domain
MHENRIYIPQPTSLQSRLMPKYSASEGSGFAVRLATMRKAAGFTQEQLAAELGISRRRIAYYEAESDHPPAGLLPKLAQALNTTVDELLGEQTPKRNARPASLSPRLVRRLRQIEHLSPKSKQQLLSIIDTFIAADRTRQEPRS